MTSAGELLDKYVSRTCPFEERDGLLVALPEGSPTLVTMGPWPALVFREADGRRSVAALIAFFRQGYAGTPPAELERAVCDAVLSLAKGPHHLVELTDEPSDDDDDDDDDDPEGVALSEKLADLLVEEDPVGPETYRGDRGVSLVFDVALERPVTKSRAAELSGDWRGRDAATGAWTYVIASSEPLDLDRLERVVMLDEPFAVSALLEKLEEARREVALIGGVIASTSMTAEAAAARAGELVALRDSLEADDGGCVRVFVDLEERPPAVAMTALLAVLGFEPRDNDYAYTNVEGCLGDDALMRVGWFDDSAALGLWFDPARAPNPMAWVGAMLDVAAYLADRFDGSLIDEAGEAIDPALLRARTADLVARIRAAGLEPGRSAMLLL